MNQTKQASPRPFTRLYVVPILFLLFICGASPQATRGQGQWTTHSTSTDDINNTNTGNVGIGTGTTAPTQKLVVNGNALFGGTTARTEVMTGFAFTINPALLEINSGAATSNNSRYSVLSLVTNQAGMGNLVGGIYFSNSAYAGSDKRLAAITSGTDGNLNAGDLRFATSGAGGPIDRMRITPSGRIGINTSNPVGLLNVTGNGTNNIDVSTYNVLINAQQGTLGGNQTRHSVFGSVSLFHNDTKASGVYGHAVAHVGENYAAGDMAGVRGYAAAPEYTTIPPPGTPLFRTYGGHFVGENPNTGGGHGNPHYMYGIYAKAGSAHTTATEVQFAGYFENGVSAGNDAYGIFQATAGARNYFAGNVGIGTTSPAYKLDVNGEINASGLRINGTPVATGNSSQWTTSGSNIHFNTGNIGIGTTVPEYRLDVADRIRIRQGASPSAGVWFFQSTPNADRAFVGMADDNHLGFWGSGLGFWGMTMDVNNGNVGIGTAPNPAKKLNVVGDMNVSGRITGGVIEAKYQDVAEWVESSQKLEAGTVVALDPERSNQVLASSKAYDTRVAGVISAQPGISLGERGEGKVLVATTGRVKVRVDATRAPIKIGDLLVTSDVAGMAMKSEPISVGGRQMHSPGTLIGKALEPLAKGTGEILVLLSLQ